jgi:4-amino-4-deoxy-L-arabinose transferase-like glycosyltransferase
VPWYAAVQHANPSFFREFFIQHNLDRFATNRFQHQQHFWYYVPVLLTGTLPWTIFVFAALTRGLRALRATKEDALPAFLSLWVILPFLFFSISQSKLPGYILPSIAPCGLLVALYIQQKHAEKPSSVVIALHAALSGTVLAVVLIAPYKLYRMPVPAQVWRIAIPVALIVAFSVAVVVFAKGYSTLRIATVVPLAMALIFLLRAAGPVIDATQSTRLVAQRISESFASHDPVLMYDVPRGVEYGLAFYLDRPLPAPPPDEIVKFGTAGAANTDRARTLKDISNSLPPTHGNYLVVLRTGEINRFAAEIPPTYQVEPFFRFQPQRLDLYYLRDVSSTR